MSEIACRKVSRLASRYDLLNSVSFSQRRSDFSSTPTDSAAFSSVGSWSTASMASSCLVESKSGVMGIFAQKGIARA